MATIKRFEDLEIWIIARRLTKDIYELTVQENFKTEYKLKEQIKSSSGSVMDNIAEGFGRGSRLEFVQFLSIAKGSLDEVKSQLYRILDYALISNEIFDALYQIADNLGGKIFKFIEYLNSADQKGLKFKNRK
ncbi:MAG: four helix bundle protein [Chitinophagaceae bacterium]|nr:four helix bundle protein [Chitinophagaceae bacterium]